MNYRIRCYAHTLSGSSQLLPLCSPPRPAKGETVFRVLMIVPLTPSIRFPNWVPMTVSLSHCGCVHLSEAHCVLSLSRALADILRQQGPIPIAHCERETISAIDTSPKENTPVRSTSKNHYTPVRTAKQTPGKWELLISKLYRCRGEVVVVLLRDSSDVSAVSGQVVERAAVADRQGRFV